MFPEARGAASTPRGTETLGGRGPVCSSKWKGSFSWLQVRCPPFPGRSPGAWLPGERGGVDSLFALVGAVLSAPLAPEPFVEPVGSPPAYTTGRQLRSGDPTPRPAGPSWASWDPGHLVFTQKLC